MAADDPEYLIGSDPAGKEVLESMKRGTSAIHWGEYPQDTINSGSMFFLNTGKALFAVTARHVFESYVERAQERILTCQIGNMRFDPASRLISTGKEVDIATFRITPGELADLRMATMPWPPFIPPEGNGVLLCGFPRYGRFAHKPGGVTFSYFSGLMRVDNVSDRSISMLRQPGEEMVDVLGVGLPEPNLDIGGMSGGPIAGMLRTQSDLLLWFISGVIVEGHQTLDIIYGARADWINEDGTIKG